jgi:hypothetical protein
MHTATTSSFAYQNQSFRIKQRLSFSETSDLELLRSSAGLLLRIQIVFQPSRLALNNHGSMCFGGGRGETGVRGRRRAEGGTKSEQGSKYEAIERREWLVAVILLWCSSVVAIKSQEVAGGCEMLCEVVYHGMIWWMV